MVGGETREAGGEMREAGGGMREAGGEMRVKIIDFGSNISG